MQMTQLTDVEILGALRAYVKSSLLGQGAIQGDDGFSPTVVVKTNTDSEYVLTITDANGSYDTPNLKGSDISLLADEFSTAENYTKGDVVAYNGVLYQFNTNHSAGAWNSAEVTEKNIADLIAEVSASGATYNVLNYGIKRGDYPAENRDAFAQLLVDVPNGATIYFPCGEYIFAPMNGTFSLTKDLYIIGDGLDVSILEYKFQDTTGHHALSLNGSGINFMLKDICMKIDFDSGDNIPASEGQLVNLIGTFNNIVIDRVYLHTGGNLDGTDMPTYNLIFSKAGCNNLEVSGCIFEALLHRHYGGCVWFSPYLKTNNDVSTYVLDTLRIHDNLFRTTNGDEAIAVWEGGNATAHGVINHCFIYDNTIYHDDFNGTSFPTANIIAVYQSRDVEENIDCKIINNNIRVKRNSGASIIKIIGYSGVDIIDNSIILDDYCETTQTFMRIFAIENKAVVTIKDNELKSNVTTHELWITNGKGSITYIGNKLFAKNKGISFTGSVVETATADMAFTVVRNDIVVNSTSNNPYISVYLGGTPTNAELREFAFVGNRIKGVKSLRTYMHGGKLIFKENSFDVEFTYSHEYTQSEALIDWENNNNIVFSSPNTSPSARVNMFIYLGYKSGLVFVGQDDSDATTSKYFVNCKISYLDLDIKPLADEINALAPIIGEYLPTSNGSTTKKRTVAIGETSTTFYAGGFMTKYGAYGSDLNLEVSAVTANGDVVACNNISVDGTNGVVTITFNEITEETTVACKVSKIQ